MEFETAIALDPNDANAHAFVGFLKVYFGRAEDGFAEVETAFRLSPRDPGAPWWRFCMCVLHTISRSGSRRSHGARSRSRASLRFFSVRRTRRRLGLGGRDKERRRPSLNWRKFSRLHRAGLGRKAPER